MSDLTDRLLVINSGSSSVKFAVYEGDGLDCILRGGLSRSNAHGLVLTVTGDRLGLLDGLEAPQDGLSHDALGWLLHALAGRLGSVAAVGHRIVHGGTRHVAPTVLNAAILADLQRLIPLAPLHEPHNLNGVIVAQKAWPQAVQVGCFDTAFHSTQSQAAQRFAIPTELHEAGVRRYGFHGLSYQFIAETLPDHIGAEAASGRVIAAHLGNGASMCAMRDGKSVVTTMGMTALDGLMMGTRSGSIDPGAVLHMIQRMGMSPADVSELLYDRSGLKGVSGISGDLRVLEASDDPAAHEALELFAWRARLTIGGLAATLGGLDVLVFTGGIGENSAAMRARICTEMGWLGIDLDPQANRESAVAIGSAQGSVQVLVIPTDEEVVIAQATRRLAAG